MVDSESRERLLLNALVAYSDSCTRPSLTPGCPYYRVTEDGPTCGEQCRQIAEEMGFAQRPVVTENIGGLRMTGRSVPREVVAGAEEFDARRHFLSDRHHPARKQSASTLLLRLRTACTNTVLGDPPGPDEESASAIWQELSDRKFPIAQAAAGGLNWTLALAAATRSASGRLRALGLLAAPPHSASVQDQWEDFAIKVVSDHEILGKRENIDVSRRRAERIRGTRVNLPSWLRDLGDSVSVIEGLLKDPLLAFIFGPTFVPRLSQWFGRLLGEGRIIRLDKVPDERVFSSLPAQDYVDEAGLWLWTRLTETNLDVWSLSSLLSEWEWVAREKDHGIPRNVLSLRTIDHDRLTSACLDALNESRSFTQTAGFDAHEFVSEAIKHLRQGDARKAADLFAGLSQLRPADAAVWNNLGFCQLAFDPSAALASLSKAAMFSIGNDQIRLANQVFALHLLRRDSDALELAKAALGAPTDSDAATMWSPGHSDMPEVLVSVTDLSAYIRDLEEHIIQHRCA